MHTCTYFMPHISPFNGHTLGTVQNSIANATSKECHSAQGTSNVTETSQKVFELGSMANCFWLIASGTEWQKCVLEVTDVGDVRAYISLYNNIYSTYVEPTIIYT